MQGHTQYASELPAVRRLAKVISLSFSSTKWIIVGDYDLGFTSNHYLIMAKEGLCSFSENNLNMYYRIFADKKYDADVEAKLKAIVFLWARNNGMFSIRNYHYPLAATLVMIAVLVFVQAILVFVIGKSVKKDSLIDRIRFDN